MKTKAIILVITIMLTSCIATPTPPVSPPITPTPPKSPPVTPTLVSPPRIVQAAPLIFRNGGFERPYTVRASAETVAQYWFPYHSDVPPCIPGQAGCALPCPENCGTCTKSDLGCWWASPEWGESWYADVQRVRSGQSAQMMFVYAREGDPYIYQQVDVRPSSVITFSTYIQAWQCFDSSWCNLEALTKPKLPDGSPNPIYSPDRVTKLMQAWGCTDYKVCRYWTISDLPDRMNLRVGIDTTGTISPTASSVVWSPIGESFDVWSKFTVTATAKSSRVTLWVSSRPMFNYARTNNNVFVDDATFETSRPYNYIYLPLVRK